MNKTDYQNYYQMCPKNTFISFSGFLKKPNMTFSIPTTNLHSFCKNFLLWKQYQILLVSNCFWITFLFQKSLFLKWVFGGCFLYMFSYWGEHLAKSILCASHINPPLDGRDRSYSLCQRGNSILQTEISGLKIT